MPELPEVETMCRGIAPTLGATISNIEKPKCTKRPIEIRPGFAAIKRRLIGTTIDKISRLGKRAILWSSSGDALIFEPRMTGIVMLQDPPTQEHLRFRITFDKKDLELLFWDRRGLGKIQLVNQKQYDSEIASKIGPDALDIDESVLAEAFGKSTRAVKVALLDQAGVAGIGNLYASEILYVAGVDPRTQCNRIKKAQWSRISSATLEILNDAIRYEGSTLSDGTYRNAVNGEGSYQNQHQVYDRAELPCPVCNTPILRIVQAQRSTFFCENCQKKT